jgi:hypothetical protein
MKLPTRFLINFPLGIFLGALFTFVLVLFFDVTVSSDLKRVYIFLFSSSATLLAATLAVAGVLKNIDNQNLLAEEQRKRSLASARAFLPVALSEMCQIARLGVLHCWGGHSKVVELGFEEYREHSIRELRLSDEIVSVFREYIKHSDEQNGEKIALILREYQIFFARWRGRFEDDHYFEHEDPQVRAEHTTSWAYLYALSSSVFEHARGDAEFIVLPAEERNVIHTALSIIGVLHGNEGSFEKFVDMYQRRFDRLF